MFKFTCPFCIREYDKNKIQCVCPECKEIIIPKSFQLGPLKCKNSDCGGFVTIRKCPFCGEELPKTALETQNLPFSIVGVSNSGKTNYITVMLHELGKGSGLRLTLGHQNRTTLEHQNENYKRIYEDHKSPEGTAGGTSMPQIWYIKNNLKKHGNIVPTYTFTIFDGAGEDHENRLDISSTECRYIQASKAIIIALDPLILSNIRKGGIVDEKIMINSLAGSKGEHKNAVDIVNSLADYIKTARGIHINKILTIPVAIVLTKFDTIISHKSFGPNALIKSPSLNVIDGKVSMSEIRQVHEEIQSWLYEIGEGSFIDALTSNFKEFYFFGVSSYGEPPKNDLTISEHIRPHRVLDPILWLFKNANFID